LKGILSVKCLFLTFRKNKESFGVGLKSLFSLQKANLKSAIISITSNLRTYAWSTKYRRKKKLITQFSCKSRDKSFEPN
jgi:hypothetical protein